MKKNIYVSLGKIKKKKVLNLLEKFKKAELRFDLLKLSDEDICKIFEKYKDLIVTYRADKVGIKDSDRIKVYQNALKNNINYIDIEIKSDDKIINTILEKSKKRDTEIIMSYHNYNITPRREYLNKIIEKAKKYNPDYIKIATKINDTQDLRVLLSLLEYENIIPVPMGKKGSIFRIFSYFIDIPIIYTKYEDKQVAPGQINYSNMLDIIKELKEYEE